MEREHTSRMAEAEAAVRRLQVECEHQLEIERDRWAQQGMGHTGDMGGVGSCTAGEEVYWALRYY